MIPFNQALSRIIYSSYRRFPDGRMSLDTLVLPPALYVPVEGGLAIFGEVP